MRSTSGWFDKVQIYRHVVKEYGKSVEGFTLTSCKYVLNGARKRVLRREAVADGYNDDNSLVTRLVGKSRGFRTKNAALYLSRVTFKGTSASIYGSEVVTT